MKAKEEDKKFAIFCEITDDDCRAKVNAAVDRIYKLENPWQPIETAPKDGTQVFLCGGETDEDDYMGEGVDVTRPVSAFFHGGQWSVCYWDGAWRTEYRAPTHWMIPEPPQ